MARGKFHRATTGRLFFPRSSAEAFPAERAGSIQGPYRQPLAWRVCDLVCWVGLAVMLGLCVVGVFR